MTFAKNTLVGANFTDARNVGSGTDVVTGDYTSEATINAGLTSANAGYYTAARLATMTLNDKVFALRSEVDSAGFKPGGTITGDPVLLAAPAAKGKTK